MHRHQEGSRAYHRAISQLSHTSLAASWCLDSCRMCLTSDKPGCNLLRARLVVAASKSGSALWLAGFTQV